MEKGEGYMEKGRVRKEKRGWNRVDGEGWGVK